MNKEKKIFLMKKANLIRQNIIKAIGTLGVGHVGGSMSLAEVLAVLYYSEMKIKEGEPNWEERDRLVLSKGHAGPALYSVFADIGYIPEEWLYTLNQPNTKLPSHCDRLVTPGIDMTSGSLGQGLSAAIGMAIALKLDKKDNYVYCIMGDGEIQEGQIWEAAMYGGNRKLDNLIAFVDYNKMQIDGKTDEINSIEPLVEKWESFNWHVQSINGHDVEEIDEAIKIAKDKKDKTSVIILNTIKGKGAYFAENKLSSHNMPLTKEEMEKALELLRNEVKEYDFR
ncbi:MULTISPECIES: transketolase [Marinitoga]|uniref:Transketolase n=1 Tax=Marinitoga aeolica TaxID=2809031 RepID=A0ABY8PSK9_9BACT|nr:MULTISPECIES: transketolase [Marinitoga]WGS65617.1 transketolase [Marinitoga aeolica]